jgi:methionine sulfoxide reductase heme-binding subunit
MTTWTTPSHGSAHRVPQEVPDLYELYAAVRGTSGVPPVGTGGILSTLGERLPGPGRRVVETVRAVVVLVLVLAGSLVVGSLVGTHGRTLVHSKMLPWILGRTFGLASYVALTAMVVLGIWLRHPWRSRFPGPAPASILWAHVTLAASTLTLLAGHLTALALDRYAGVGWTGVFVPWGATFRPTGVALGTFALYALLIVAGTAALAGSIGRRVWFPIHTVSVVVFCLTLAHGVMAGSDGYALRWAYVASGAMVLILQGTRWLSSWAGHGAAAVVE